MKVVAALVGSLVFTISVELALMCLTPPWLTARPINDHTAPGTPPLPGPMPEP